MPKRVVTLDREDIKNLTDRLTARARLGISPELRRDLLCATAVLRTALSIGFPVRPIQVEIEETTARHDRSKSSRRKYARRPKRLLLSRWRKHFQRRRGDDDGR